MPSIKLRRIIEYLYEHGPRTAQEIAKGADWDFTTLGVTRTCSKYPDIFKTDENGCISLQRYEYRYQCRTCGNTISILPQIYPSFDEKPPRCPKCRTCSWELISQQETEA